MTLKPEPYDPLGEAVKDYFTTGKATNIKVYCNKADDDVIPTPYLFREYNQMPPLEQLALEHCHGSTLDVGAAAGSHALWLQKKGLQVCAVDISKACCEVMKQRGVDRVVHANFFNLGIQHIDTLLLLMNGIGIAGSLSGLHSLLEKARNMLNDDGQVIFDSSDISYLYREEDGTIRLNLNDAYYGELEYTMEYKNQSGSTFQWLFIDYATLRDIAMEHRFEAQLLATGEHYDYLVSLKKLPL